MLSVFVVRVHHTPNGVHTYTIVVVFERTILLLDSSLTFRPFAKQVTYFSVICFALSHSLLHERSYVFQHSHRIML